jgi:hypothetical protein
MPFLFVRKGMTRNWLGVSNAIASGFMLAASVGLLWQGWALGFGRLGLGRVWAFFGRAGRSGSAASV